LPIERIHLSLRFAQRLAATMFPLRQSSITGPGHLAAALTLMGNFAGN
jgi:hypothetical protein